MLWGICLAVLLFLSGFIGIVYPPDILLLLLLLIHRVVVYTRFILCYRFG